VAVSTHVLALEATIWRGEGGEIIRWLDEVGGGVVAERRMSSYVLQGIHSVTVDRACVTEGWIVRRNFPFPRFA
jgi:acyl-CoA hydrolase